MTLERVKSSGVYALGYDDECGVMAVVFKAYEYPITREAFESIKNAPSIGQAVTAAIGRAPETAKPGTLLQDHLKSKAKEAPDCSFEVASPSYARR